ncbi:hypothetical protein ACFE04_001754 [Oxalis oulophora]
MENNNSSNPSSSSSKTDRKLIEKNRRNQMKALCHQLNSLVPYHQTSRESTSLPDQLFEAANYIKKKQVNLERMKEKKSSLTRSNIARDGEIDNVGSSSPKVEIRAIGSTLEIILITGLDCHQHFFRETIRVLHEEGAEIVNANFSVVEDSVFHNIHSKVGDQPGSACDASRIGAKLINLVHNVRFF